MRILVATDQWSPDVIGGSARVAADTARALADRGHDVVVVAPAHRGLPVVERDGAVEVRRLIRRGVFPQTLADPLLTRRQARRLRDRSFDLAVAHQATTAAGLAWAVPHTPLAFVFHASVVLEMRFLRRHVARARSAALYALDPFLTALERKAVGSATGILALSRFSADLLASRHPLARSNLHVVGAGVDDAFFDPPSDPDECRSRLGIPPGVLLFTSRRLEPRMGVDILIDAMALLQDDVVLAVAGTGRLHESLKRRIRVLGLQHRVRLLGHVPDEDLRSLYAAADLFVLPTVAYEGFGMSTLEALAAGTPALGTAVGATPEILGDLGPEFVVARVDSESLANALRAALPLLTPDLRARARRVAEAKYRWKQAIAHWEEALLTIADVDAKRPTATL